MADKSTIDSNILVYAFSSANDPRKEIAKQILSKCYIISLQAINETAYVLYKKFDLTPDQLESIVQFMKKQFLITDLTTGILDKTLKLLKKNNFNFWDNMMIASALQNRRTLLYSEDMNHNQIVENKLKIINPFTLIKK
jgi:predicted nucleic acid-binding protein